MPKTRVLIVSTVVAALAAVAGVAVGQTFSDVAPSHPFYEEIEWMAENEISTGYADGTYRPRAAVSRMAMSAFMERMATNLLPRAAHASVGFTQGFGEVSTSITAPADGFLVVSATSDLTRFDVEDDAVCGVGVGGFLIPDAEAYVTVGGNLPETICTVTTQVAVAAGDHVVTLAFDGSLIGRDDLTEFYSSNISVLWVPHDGSGNPPAAADIASATDGAQDVSGRLGASVEGRQTD